MSSQQSQVWWVELELEDDGSYEPTMNEIVRDIANNKITHDQREMLSTEALAQLETEKAVEVAVEMLKDKDAELKKLEEPPDAFVCPISHETMLDPVIDKEGNSYERAAIMEWLRNKYTSPVTRNPLSRKDLTENRALKNAIHEYYEQTGQKIPETPPVSEAATAAAAAATAAEAAAAEARAARQQQLQEAAAAINTDDVYTLLTHYGVGFMIDEETEGGGLYGTHGMSRTFEDGREDYQYDLEQLILRGQPDDYNNDGPNEYGGPWSAELELQYYYYVYPIRAPDEGGEVENLEGYNGQTLAELFVEVGGEQFLRELVDNPDWPEFYNPGALAFNVGTDEGRAAADAHFRLLAQMQVVEDAAPAQAAAPQAAAVPAQAAEEAPGPHRRHGPWAHPGDERWLGGGAHHPAAAADAAADAAAALVQAAAAAEQQEQEQPAAAAAAAAAEEPRFNGGRCLSCDRRLGDPFYETGLGAVCVICGGDAPTLHDPQLYADRNEDDAIAFLQQQQQQEQ